MTNSISNELIVWVSSVICTLITAVLLPLITSALKSKIKNNQWANVIDEITNAVSTSVDCVQQTMVEQLKADGKFDKENQQDALKKAVELTLQSLSSTTKKAISDENIDIEQMLIKYIESAIINKKNKIIIN